MDVPHFSGMLVGKDQELNFDILQVVRQKFQHFEGFTVIPEEFIQLFKKILVLLIKMRKKAGIQLAEFWLRLGIRTQMQSDLVNTVDNALMADFQLTNQIISF